MTSVGDANSNEKKNNLELEEILKKSFAENGRKYLVNVDGVTLPVTYKTFRDNINNFEVNEQDVWICGFAKSGTTWCQEMIWLIMNNLDFRQAKEKGIQVRSPFFESALFEFDEKINNNKPVAEMNVITNRQSINAPLCLKSHLPFNLLPKQIRDGTKKPKIVYVRRNPKDACVSYYYHSRLFDGYIGTFDDFCELFLAGKLVHTPYWNNILSYWDQRHRPNILLLKYEDMKRDLPSIIRQTAIFLERPLNEQQINILTEHLLFKNMKKNPAANMKVFSDFYKQEKLTNYDGEFMRSGSVGDYKTHMSPETINKFNEWIKANTKDKEFKKYFD